MIHGACGKKTRDSLLAGEVGLRRSALSDNALAAGAGRDNEHTRTQDLRKIIE
jgi:hypothetical protein